MVRRSFEGNVLLLRVCKLVHWFVHDVCVFDKLCVLFDSIVLIEKNTRVAGLTEDASRRDVDCGEASLARKGSHELGVLFTSIRSFDTPKTNHQSAQRPPTNLIVPPGAFVAFSRKHSRQDACSVRRLTHPAAPIATTQQLQREHQLLRAWQARSSHRSGLEGHWRPR